LVEGGATLGSSLLADGLVDRLVIFQAPVILGAGALSAFAAFPAQRAGQAPRFRVVERKALGADLMTVYAVSGD
jgi:diaminohydroxyphosphoribosylaminopyrimidine deaminase/5-amino-6-(5-phosphoribosylamino)uracil reductase